MERTIDLLEISDGKIYSLNDMAKLGANNCAGCSACCRDRGDSVTLDPYDVYQLKQGLGMTFEQLLGGMVTLGVIEGLIRPSLSMQETGMKDANGEAHSFGTAVTVCGTVEIDWYVIPNDTKNAFVMTLRGALKSETLTLVYDEDGDIWTFSRKGN